MGKTITKICEYCGRSFTRKDNKRGRGQRLCSRKCSGAVNGKANEGRRHTEEWKRKMSEANSGTGNPFFGKTHTEDAKRKIGTANSGSYIDRYGEEKANKIKAKLSDAHSGSNNPFYGKTHPPEIRKNLGRDVSGEKNPMFNKGHLLVGDKNGSWKGGISYEAYGREWTSELKTEIRKRDKFVCQVCGKNGYDVHHIDYVKKNCIEQNLITLCRSCHAKTNFNREHWQAFFKSKIEEKYGK